MADRLIVFLDANVLYPAALRDFFMRLALQDLFQARWSNQVHEEWMEAVQRDFPNITRTQLERTRDLMNRNAVDSLVTGFEPRIASIKLPDPDDRHVLAAAITGAAARIITFNLKDFPPAALQPYAIKAQHPDGFIIQLMEMDIERVCAAARQHRQNLKNPPKTAEEYLVTLERQGLVKTAAHLRKFVALI